MPDVGFIEAYVRALVSVVRGYGGRLEADVEVVMERNKMWAYGEMREEDVRQVRGGYVVMRVVG